MTSQSSKDSIDNLIHHHTQSQHPVPASHNTASCPTRLDKPVRNEPVFNEPAELIQQLKTNTTGYCLFLDIDGTLADFCDDPEQSFIPQSTLAAIEAIMHYQVPVIAVTGRHIEVAQQLFKQLSLPVAGLHGLDIMLDRNNSLSPDLSHIDFVRLRQKLEHACTEYPRLLLEDKQHSFALHYRQCPELEPVAHDIMQQLQASYPHMKLNHGKCVVEILPKQADKGHAIQIILAHLQLEHVTPLFIGDDVTDESGFRAVNAQQGISIKVGTGSTDAIYRLKDTATVAEFLNQFHQFLYRGAVSNEAGRRAQAQHGEETCQN